MFRMDLEYIVPPNVSMKTREQGNGSIVKVVARISIEHPNIFCSQKARNIFVTNRAKLSGEIKSLAVRDMPPGGTDEVHIAI